VFCLFKGVTLQIERRIILENTEPPMSSVFYDDLSRDLDGIRAEGLYKTERLITGEQDAAITVGGKEVLNLLPPQRLRLMNMGLGWLL